MKKKLITLFAILSMGFATVTNASVATFQQSTQHLKKDGSVDKRFNENKHLKKDGTPDLRYSTSKKAAAKTTVKKTTKKS